jgi:hypothetical protein
MIRLEDATPAAIAKLIDYAPQYGPTSFKKLVQDAVGAIHQVPRAFAVRNQAPLDLKDIVAYFGRSSGSEYGIASNVYSAFQRGLGRGDTHGMVFAQTSIKASLKYERWGISLINYLKENDGLCISNKTLTARGGVGAVEPGFLYITFRFMRGKEYANMLTQAEINEGIRQIVEEMEALNVKSQNELHEGISAGLIKANDVQYVGTKAIRLFK